MIVMPDGVTVYNGSHERCDMADGPCSCGAWHKLEDWTVQIREQIERLTAEQKDK